MPHNPNIPDSAGPYQCVAEAAHVYLAAGRSLGPVPPNRKYPEGNAWKRYQDQLPTPTELVKWFDGHSPMGLFLICGKVSGGLEVIDCDQLAIYHAFVGLVQALGYDELLQRLVIEHTPKPGVHLGPPGAKRNFFTVRRTVVSPHSTVMIGLGT